MITQLGQSLIASYLAGKAPTYATHIALGCGSKPGIFSSYNTLFYKDELDFEMFRVPITSKSPGLDNDGMSIISLGADLPTQNTYNFTEIGIFSGAENPAAGSNGSKVLFSFTQSEAWQFHSDLTTPVVQTALNKPILESLDNAASPTNTIRNLESLDPTNYIPVIQTSINNPIFANTDRMQRYETCRFFNTAIAMPGDTANILSQSGTLSVSDVVFGQTYSVSKGKIQDDGSNSLVTITTSENNKILPGDYVKFGGFDNASFTYLNSGKYKIKSATDNTISFNTSKKTPVTEVTLTSDSAIVSVEKMSSHLHLKNDQTIKTLDVNQANQDDEIRLAFSIVNRVGANTSNAGIIEQPSAVKIIVEFSTNDSTTNRQVAKMNIELNNGQNGIDFSLNRYFVISKKMSELVRSTSFAWTNVNVVRIYGCVINQAGVPSNDFYIFFDGMRLENKTAVSPLYGLSGYSVVNFSNQMPVEKLANTKNAVEFQFRLSTVDPGGP
jgi:hypothetical protein